MRSHCAFDAQSSARPDGLSTGESPLTRVDVVRRQQRPAQVHDDEPTTPFEPLIAVNRAEQCESGGAARLANTTDTTTALSDNNPREAVGGGAP
jgi:hypothetical protein